MFEPLSFERVAGAIRRQWWLIVLVACIAAATGYVVSVKTADVHTGVATILIDTAPSSRYRGMPIPDDLVKAVSGSRIRGAVAKALGTDESTVAANLRAAAAGNPLTQIRVTYSASSKDAAEEGALAGATEMVSYVLETAKPEIAIREGQIKASETAITALNDAIKAGTASRDATYQRWSIETQLLDFKSALDRVTGVYSFDGTVTSSVARASAVRRNNAFGGLIVGLALGILLAGAREVLTKRA